MSKKVTALPGIVGRSENWRTLMELFTGELVSLTYTNGLHKGLISEALEVLRTRNTEEADAVLLRLVDALEEFTPAGYFFGQDCTQLDSPWGYFPQDNAVPDISELTREELYAMWRLTHNSLLHTARLYFPSRPTGYVRATRQLGELAATRAASMVCREAGEIIGAIAHELMCQEMYDRLPEYARW